MKKSRKSAREKLDREENDLLSSFEKGEWKTVTNIKKEKSHARKAAAKTTLIASVLYKYAAGHLAL